MIIKEKKTKHNLFWSPLTVLLNIVGFDHVQSLTHVSHVWPSILVDYLVMEMPV